MTDYAYLGLIIGGDGGVDNSVTDFVAFDNLQLPRADVALVWSYQDAENDLYATVGFFKIEADIH